MCAPGFSRSGADSEMLCRRSLVEDRPMFEGRLDNRGHGVVSNFRKLGLAFGYAGKPRNGRAEGIRGMPALWRCGAAAALLVRFC